MYVLERTNGNQKEAARILLVRPTTLHYKMRRLGVTPVRRFESGDLPRIG
jgi:transcriptional regulator with GAF, ATPase, and Fis domain